MNNKIIICTEYTKYNITKTNEYEVIKEDDNYYFIINDVNDEKKYSKNFFIEKKNNIDFNDFVNECKHVTSNLINFRGIAPHEILYINIVRNSNSNCGLKEFHGLHLTLERIEKYIKLLSEKTGKKISSIDKEKITMYLFYNWFECLKLDYGSDTGLFLFSGKIPDNFTKDGKRLNKVFGIINQIGTVSNSIKNPNSSNDIFAFISTTIDIDSLNILEYINDKFKDE